MFREIKYLNIQQVKYVYCIYAKLQKTDKHQKATRVSLNFAMNIFTSPQNGSDIKIDTKMGKDVQELTNQFLTLYPHTKSLMDNISRINNNYSVCLRVPVVYKNMTKTMTT